MLYFQSRKLLIGFRKNLKSIYFEWFLRAKNYFPSVKHRGFHYSMMAQFLGFLGAPAASLALSIFCVCFCFRFRKCQKFSQYLHLGFEIIFRHKFALEFFPQGLKHHLFTCGGLLNRKMMTTDLWVGLLIVQKCQKMIILVYPYIQFLSP